MRILVFVGLLLLWSGAAASPARDAAMDRGVTLTDTRPGFAGVLSTGAPLTASPPVRPTQ